MESDDPRYFKSGINFDTNIYFSPSGSRSKSDDSINAVNGEPSALCPISWLNKKLSSVVSNLLAATGLSNIYAGFHAVLTNPSLVVPIDHDCSR